MEVLDMALGLTPQQLLMKAQTVRNDMKGLGLDASEQGRLTDPVSNAAYKASIERVQAAEGKKNVIGERERAAFDLMKMGFGVAKGLKRPTDARSQARRGEFDTEKMAELSPEERADLYQEPDVDVNKLASDFLAQPSSVEMTRPHDPQYGDMGLTPEQIGGMRGIFARMFGG